MDFIKLFNIVSDVARPAHAGENPARSMDDKFADIGIDSLDGLIMTIYFCEIYGIPEDDETKDWNASCVQDVYDYVMRRKSRDPESLDAVREAIK